MTEEHRFEGDDQHDAQGQAEGIDINTHGVALLSDNTLVRKVPVGKKDHKGLSLFH